MWMRQIKNRYFYGISVKLFLISKISLAIFILLSFYPQSLSFTILEHKVNLVPVIGVVLILIISYSYNKMLAGPLVKINDTVSKIANLDFSTKCDVNSDDELGELSNNLNFISCKLSNTISNLETELENKHRLLKTLREFSDSLSHEMKTPLGIIKAYAEGLKDQISPEKQNKYIDTIIDEADRMNNLIVELLNLSAMETGAIPLYIQKFDVIELIEEVAGRILVDTTDSNFNVVCDFENTSLYINADKNKMEQVLSNLINNASKYVLDNGEIRLTVKNNVEKIHIEVYNKGELIPHNKIPRIWDRFYRMDSSRNKKTGGSGLGLAMVAQILTMHNFGYGVRNETEGVSFYIIIPLWI